MSDSRLRQSPITTKVGPFVVRPIYDSTRNVQISYMLEKQEMWVERADIEDLIAALQAAYEIS